MRIAYLTNRYPAASHSFIRREIEAVEAEGAEVFRFSVRAAETTSLPDARDQAELTKTQVLLTSGLRRLLWDGLRTIGASSETQPCSFKDRFWKIRLEVHHIGSPNGLFS